MADDLPEKYRLDVVTNKKCLVCKQVKPATEFHKGSTFSRLSSYCKKCQRERSRNNWINRLKKSWMNKQS
jgi:hypothetical protein